MKSLLSVSAVLALVAGTVVADDHAAGHADVGDIAEVSATVDANAHGAPVVGSRGEEGGAPHHTGTVAGDGADHGGEAGHGDSGHEGHDAH